MVASPGHKPNTVNWSKCEFELQPTTPSASPCSSSLSRPRSQRYQFSISASLPSPSSTLRSPPICVLHMAQPRSKLKLPPQTAGVTASVVDPTPLRWLEESHAKGSHRVTRFRLLASVKDLYDGETTYRTQDREPQHLLLERSTIEEDSRRQFYRLLSALPASSFKYLTSLELHIEKHGGRPTWFFNLCSRLQKDEDIRIARLKIQGVFECDDGVDGPGCDGDECNRFTFKKLEDFDFDLMCSREGRDGTHRCSAKGFNRLLENSPNANKIRLSLRKTGSYPTMNLGQLNICTTPMEDLEELIIEGGGISIDEDDQHRVAEVQPKSCKIKFGDQDSKDPAFRASTSRSISPSSSTSSAASSTYDADHESDENESSDAPEEDYTVTVGPIPNPSASEDVDDGDDDDYSGGKGAHSFVRSAAPSPPSIVGDSQPTSPSLTGLAASFSDVDDSLERAAEHALEDGALRFADARGSTPQRLSDAFREDCLVPVGNVDVDEETDGGSNPTGSESSGIFTRSAAPSPPSIIGDSLPPSPSLDNSIVSLSGADDSVEDALGKVEDGSFLHLAGITGSDHQHWMREGVKAESESDVGGVGGGFILHYPGGQPLRSSSANRSETLHDAFRLTEEDDCDSNTIEDSPEAGLTSPSSALTEPFPDTPPAPTMVLEALVKEKKECVSSQSD